MKARFRVLRFVAAVSKGIGWLLLLAGLVLGALIAQGLRTLPFAPIAEPLSTSNLIQGGALFGGFFLGFLLFYGAGGALRVLIAIEENIRVAAGWVDQGLPPPDETPVEVEPGPFP